MACWACFLVPTNSTDLPAFTCSRIRSYASLIETMVFCRSIMWIPLRSAKIYFFIRGSQRLVWCPKCTPDSSRLFIVTTDKRVLLQNGRSAMRYDVPRSMHPSVLLLFLTIYGGRLRGYEFKKIVSLSL